MQTAKAAKWVSPTLSLNKPTRRGPHRTLAPEAKILPIEWKIGQKVCTRQGILVRRALSRECPESAVQGNEVDKTKGAGLQDDETLSIPEKGLPRTWYPVTVHGNLSHRPLAVRVLGEDLVVWRDSEGAISVLKDRCPHRLVPLSEGHVDAKTGCLECPLHGWQFDVEGRNTRIPASTQNPPISPFRKDVPRFPVVETGDIVWAWLGDPDDPALEDSALLPGQYYPFLSSLEKEPKKTFSRVLPVDVSVVLENFFDPAHIPFAHHGKQGNQPRAHSSPVFSPRRYFLTDPPCFF